MGCMYHELTNVNTRTHKCGINVGPNMDNLPVCILGDQYAYWCSRVRICIFACYYAYSLEDCDQYAYSHPVIHIRQLNMHILSAPNIPI